MKTPFPEANPSAFTTNGFGDVKIIFFASFNDLTFQKFAVGIFASFINSFAQDLLDSNLAPSGPGPNTSKLFLRRTSPKPSAKGVSGPITTRSIFKNFSFEVNTLVLFKSKLILSDLFIFFEPALPGRR